MSSSTDPMPAEEAIWIYENVIQPIHARHPKRFAAVRPRCVCTCNADACCRRCAAGDHEQCFEIATPGWGDQAREANGDAYLVSRGLVIASVWTPGNGHATHCHCHLRGHDGWTATPQQLSLFD